jgi:hypothetical protein
MAAQIKLPIQKEKETVKSHQANNTADFEQMALRFQDKYSDDKQANQRQKNR